MTDNILPIRKKLSHEIPGWVPDASRYFITISCLRRNIDSLCNADCSQRLLDSIGVYERASKWWIHVFVLMPDHLHMIATFTRVHGVQPVISAWKSYHARKLGIEWQAGFFEHRLRNDQEFFEKAEYVRLNPVRRGLVANWKEWPHLFQRGSWDQLGGSAVTPRPTWKINAG